MSTSKRTKKFLLIIIMEKPNLNGIRISRPNEYLYINLRTVYNWFTVHYLSDRISHIFHVSWSHFFILKTFFFQSTCLFKGIFGVHAQCLKDVCMFKWTRHIFSSEQGHYLYVVRKKKHISKSILKLVRKLLSESKKGHLP